jgi:Reverse transcriptase (RNA-dependent DNA polymerase)
VPNGTSFSTDTTRIRRTRGLDRQGAFRKAAQALSSAPQAPSGPATVVCLLALHPPAVSGPVLDRSVLPPPTLISASEVESALSGFLRGSGPGASGLRHSHLSDMLHAPSPQAAALASDAITNLVNRLASGRAPTSFAPWLCGAPPTALAKPNGGVRPIAVGEVIRRLVAKCLMARVRQLAQALLAPLELGVAVKGGAEAIVHTVRRLITHHLDAAVSSDWALLQVDFSNAFNLVRRDVFCQSTLEYFPALGPWVTWYYDSPSHLFYKGEIVCSSARDVQQGDPLGPLLLCLVLRHVSLGIADIFAYAEPTTAALITSYLDYGAIWHTLGTFFRVLSYHQAPQVQDLGLSLNLAKCFVYEPNSRPTPHLLPVDIPFARGPTTGVRLLGAPIGSPSHCAGDLETVVKVSKQAHLLLTEMDDPQVELLMIRACLGSAKMTFLTRVTSPDTVAPFATAFDNSMRSCLGRIFQDDISDAQWTQAGFPLSMGGLGLTHTARVSSAAFIGSAEYSCAVVLDLVPVTSCALRPDIALDPARAHYHAQLCPEVESPPALPPAPSQASLTLPLHQGTRVLLLSASDLCNKARLQSVTLSQAVGSCAAEASEQNV